MAGRGAQGTGGDLGSPELHCLRITTRPTLSGLGVHATFSGHRLGLEEAEGSLEERMEGPVL